MPVIYHTEDCQFAFRGRTKTTQWIRQSALEEGWQTGAISIVFCSDVFLLEINKRYLNHNYLTDIITFDDSNPDTHTIAGDLVISIDTVRDNAATFGTSFENELQRVIIHGIMHLCGHKDKSSEESRKMKELEEKYLCRFYNLSASKTDANSNEKTEK